MVGRSQGSDGAEDQGRVKRALGLCALVLCGLGCCSLPAQGASAAGRDLRLSLALIAGDARMLADPATPPQRKEGLSERIRSSLGSLAITVRYEVQASGRSDPQLAAGAGQLPALFAAGKVEEFARESARLAAAYPLDLSYFQPLAATARRIQAGRAIYRQYCIGCHANPDATAANPAPDLFRLARTEPRAALLARLLGGVHGDRMTSLENPFTDEAIASLAAYFITRQERPPASGSAHRAP